MFEVTYTHQSSSSFGSNQKTFSFTGETGMVIEEKIPPQAQQIIQLTYALSQDKPQFTLNDIISYIDDNYDGTFTRSKGGTERIVRYYSKLLQNVGIITDVNAVSE